MTGFDKETLDKVIADLKQKIVEHPFQAVGLAFAVGASFAGRRARASERGILGALVAAGVAMGLRALRGHAFEQVFDTWRRHVEPTGAEPKHHN
ncbi:MAG TPA: hypothetical protein VGM88_20535 [Kofleriaceae bacterium]|jgi:hypothetical protein